MMSINPLRSYLRPWIAQHTFCPGCGAAQVMHFFIRAAEELNIDFDKLVAIGGVGCTARIPVFMYVDALHGIHGRTIPWATGIKLYNPELKVVIFAGDGDAVSIGGNHFIHAARRNLDATMIVVNNLNFAMTGGQVAPTTLEGLCTTTTPYGNPEPPFDICKLAIAAGATFVARWTTAHPRQTISAIKKALVHKGFSVLEIVAQCPTNFGRRALGTGDPVACIRWIQERAISIEEAKTLAEKETKGKFVIGIFHEERRPCFVGTSFVAAEG